VNNCYITNSVDIACDYHKHTKFPKYEASGPKQQLVDIMGCTSFLPKSTYVYFSQEKIYYCTSHKHSTETVSNASRFINKFHHCYI